MPSPVGHTIGGLAASLLANAAARRPGLSPRLLLVCVGVALAPDLDILVGSHRTYTHSLGATALVGLVGWILLWRRVPNPSAASMAIAAAHASHVLLDWLGKDSSRPPGLMALWPLSSRFFVSGYDVFREISRRYWRLDEFVLGNLMAAGWEALVLLPVLLMAWIVWSGRTLRSPMSRVESPASRVQSP